MSRAFSFLSSFELFGVVGFHAAILLAPVVERRHRDVELSGDFLVVGACGGKFVAVAQFSDDLFGACAVCVQP